MRIEWFAKQDQIKGDALPELMARTMRTLRETMLDTGMQARYRLMETEELYRGKPTIERLLVLVKRACQVHRARNDLVSVLLAIRKYETKYA